MLWASSCRYLYCKRKQHVLPWWCGRGGSRRLLGLLLGMSTTNICDFLESSGPWVQTAARLCYRNDNNYCWIDWKRGLFTTFCRHCKYDACRQQCLNGTCRSTEKLYSDWLATSLPNLCWRAGALPPSHNATNLPNHLKNI